MNSITDERVKKLYNITNEYTNTLCSISEAFDDNYYIIQQKRVKSSLDLSKFLKRNKIKTVEDLFKNPVNVKKWKDLKKSKERSALAYEILPQSFFVSLVSRYDVLIGQLIKFIYDVNPQKLYDSNNTITYRELFNINDLNKIKEQLLENKIDNILRKSHVEQINDLSNLIEGTPLSKVSFWHDFVEMTQRRNLFVHCKGVVSSQYVSECQKQGCKVKEKIGDVLSANDDYFKKAYFVFTSMGIMLSQVIARKLLIDLVGEIDTVLNSVIYEIISEKKYNIAIELSKFATARDTKHNNRLDEVYFILNYAQAYKWNGNEEKCKEILDSYDFSAMKPDILIAKYALEDDEENVISSMRLIGKSSVIMTEEAYITWEIFREMRKRKKYRETFEKIFQKPFNDNPFIDDKDLSLE